ncbi:diacylglycerol kinase family protein [Microbacterium sp. ARD32]|uniref:diacylglycerol/lipid kinase family protein n=1 Tax=Microbacterium sp. ARD32 TaxID=2962577 RepID=UPI00288129CF|nr:diacylglycerol kinase family protein [Microbacterium sp. ARD32]MDT0156175.1 diacylglycerol kinase family protein [Microbacterium sp. ARD32]
MSASGSERSHAALVLNPVKADAQRLRSALLASSHEHGWDPPRIYETSVDDPGRGVTRTAIEEGAAAVLAAGGDGTVRSVSEAMAGTGIPFAVVPSGTGNLFARNLGLPLLAPERVMDAVFTGFTHPVDIGWATLTREDGVQSEHGFVVLAGMGLDADMIANTRPDLKRSVGWVAYLDGAARSLPRATPFRVVYQLDDGRLHTVKVHSMLFANCGALPAGIALMPDASLDDGTMDVAVIQPTGPLGWLGIWRKIWWDNSVLRRTRAGRLALERRGRSASIRYLRARSAEAAMAAPTSIELDGDELGTAVRMLCRIEQGALSIVLPAGHDVSRF